MSKSLFRISRLVLPVLFFAVALAGLTFALQRTAVQKMPAWRAANL